MRMSLVPLRSLAGLTMAVSLAACDKPDPVATSPDAMVVQTVTSPNGSATSLPTGAAPGGDTDAAFGAAASTVAEPSADAAASAIAVDAAVAPVPAGKTHRGAVGATSAAVPAATACGDAPLPPCPLFAWMKAHAGPAAGHADADPATLATVFDQIAAFAPPGYPNWVSIAKDGAAAARAGQSDAAKASCRGCHTQYKTRYKTEMRSRPLT